MTLDSKSPTDTSAQALTRATSPQPIGETMSIETAPTRTTYKREDSNRTVTAHRESIARRERRNDIARYGFRG